MKKLRQFLSLGASIIGPLPVQLLDGQIADAAPVMANFNYIVSQVNANAAGGGLAPIYKTVAQSITTNAVATLDNKLFFNVTAATYVFKVHVAFIVLLTNGMRFQMGGTAPLSLARYLYSGYWDVGSGGALQGNIAVATTSWPAAANFVPSSLLNGYVEVNGFVVATAPGTVGFSWAQSVSGANPALVLAGSYLEYSVIS